MKEGDLELLAEIAKLEDSPGVAEKLPLGWEWRDVRIWPATLNRLFKEGYLDNVFKSNSYTGYRLSALGRAVLAEAEKQTAKETSETELSFPSELFNDIIGHEEVKDLLKASLQAAKPVHVLLTGPSALAKTLFLWDIERAAGEKAVWLVGSAASKAGLWDLVAQKQPQFLLIDELDKMNAADAAALLTIMEGGRLVRAKKGRELDISHPLRVVAASNRVERLSPELRSRFAVRRIQAYSRSDFLTVVKGVLVRREEMAPEMAEEIARQLDGKTQDVRDAIRVARLTPQLGVEKAIKLLLGGAGAG